MITITPVTRQQFNGYALLTAVSAKEDEGRIEVRGVTVKYRYHEPLQTLYLEIAHKPAFIGLAYAEKKLLEWVKERIESSATAERVETAETAETAKTAETK